MQACLDSGRYSITVYSFILKYPLTSVEKVIIYIIYILYI